MKIFKIYALNLIVPLANSLGSLIFRNHPQAAGKENENFKPHSTNTRGHIIIVIFKTQSFKNIRTE